MCIRDTLAPATSNNTTIPKRNRRRAPGLPYTHFPRVFLDPLGLSRLPHRPPALYPSSLCLLHTHTLGRIHFPNSHWLLSGVWHLLNHKLAGPHRSRPFQYTLPPPPIHHLPKDPPPALPPRAPCSVLRAYLSDSPTRDLTNTTQQLPIPIPLARSDRFPPTSLLPANHGQSGEQALPQYWWPSCQ